MPELPEVETTRRGITPHIVGRHVTGVIARVPALRWPLPPDLAARLVGLRLRGVERRAKYLLLDFGSGTLLLHLGMSGSLRIVDPATPPAAHDHLDITFADATVLRLRDPRRFGACLWLQEPVSTHSLLAHLGPEPLGDDFDGDYLYRLSRKRTAPVKSFLMDGRVVVGVGNIYATEALFRAGIRPRRAAGRISSARYRELAGAVRSVLSAAVDHGGTTLRDFVDGSGRPGYFRNELQAYGRGGESCVRCGGVLASDRIGQRATVWCPRCQR